MDTLLLADVAECGCELIGQRDADRVHPVRTVQRDPSNGTVDTALNFAHMYLPPPTSTTVPVM
ncbi:hypothetical protein JHV666_33770 [Mycobacterium avium subsp. hominissuis]|uniref:Uncharacterized protein n=1 Tax=Mycobacterium indicus pranii (strain DSM 45239 / MTCC 9506) TaxID=1232724 RepID=J9W7Q2_MYCIP|nr:Hypothetical protein MIP_00135 [Mycobacterium intracellulare subsp. intracellulare MTCC 9506]BCO49658.1 hypothetical protein MINTM003_00990 [Mycobacterium paraintracellulare]BCO86847.1 hypothetical protein MINTM015_01040 [Mycobacterium paraintracellulare]